MGGRKSKQGGGNQQAGCNAAPYLKKAAEPIERIYSIDILQINLYSFIEIIRGGSLK